MTYTDYDYIAAQIHEANRPSLILWNVIHGTLTLFSCLIWLPVWAGYWLYRYLKTQSEIKSAVALASYMANSPDQYWRRRYPNL